MKRNRVEKILAILIPMVAAAVLFVTSAFAAHETSVNVSGSLKNTSTNADGGVTITAEAYTSATINQSSVALTGNTVTVTDNQINATVSSQYTYLNNCSKEATGKTDVTLKVTLTNTNPGEVEIAYTASGLAGGGDIQNTDTATTIKLAAGSQVSFTVFCSSGASSATGTFTVTKLVSTAVQATTSFVAGNGGSYSITNSAGGTYVVGNSYANLSDTKYTVTATADEGMQFIHWVDDNGNILATTSSYVFNANNIIIKPVFGKMDQLPIFTIQRTGVEYSSLYDAIENASNSDTIILTKDGTLHAGNYTIPAGITLLIPYNDANTLITDNMGSYVSEASTVGNEYRRLTMANGANIIVNGAISIGSQACRLMVGQVGDYGAIVMDQGSNIAVKSGGKLYAYGYIFYGEGTGGAVIVENGGAVYETSFGVDYPGSVSNTDTVLSAEVFPLRTITVRNVEVQMTLYAGATEKVFYCVWGNTIGGNLPGYIDFIGNTSANAFSMSSGASMTKAYSDGRQRIVTNGNINVNPLTITMKYLVFDYTATSSDTTGFPIASNYDIEIASGTLTLNDNVVMFEGSTAIIAPNATLNTNGKNVYVMDASDDTGAVSRTDLHGTAYTLVDKDAVIDVNGTLIASGGFYTSTYGASIISSEGTGKIQITGSSTATTVAIRVKDYSSMLTVNITPAKLQNADGSYIQSSVSTFICENGRWICSNHTDTNGDNACDVCQKVLCQHANIIHYEAVSNICQKGNKEYWQCTDCEKYFSDEACTTIIAEGSWVLEANHSVGDWLTDDTNHWKECTGCGADVDKATHSDVNTDNDHKCDTCSKDNITEHTYTQTAYQAPTCIATGYRTYTCSICSHSYTETLATIDHTRGEAIRENEIAATCTKTGSYDEVVYCSVDGCNVELSREKKTADKIAHTPGMAVRENEVGATCHSEGSYESVVNCSVCGEELSREEKTIDKIAHIPGEVIRENEVGTTCHTAGSYDEVVYCSVEACRAEISRTSKTIDKIAHTPGKAVEEDRAESTCHSEGSYNLVIYCTAEGCGAEISSTSQTIAKKDHTPGEAVQENYKAVTCYAEGSYEEVVYCSVEACKHEIIRTPKTIEKIAHNPAAAVHENEVAATCGTAGSHESVVYCSVEACKHEISRETVVDPATGQHIYDNDCDTGCNNCSHTREIQHDYDAVVTPPTCIKGGYTTYTCSVCGDSYKGAETEKSSHTAGEPVVENSTAATCGHTGSYDEVVYCSVCGEKLSSDHKTVDALPHSPSAAVEENRVESTCTVAGSYESVVKCSVCGEELSRETKALELAAHTPGEAVREHEVGATCHTVGSYDEVIYCSVGGCGAEISRTSKTIDKIAHTPGEAVEEDRVESTCHSEGSYDEVIYCSVEGCGAEISSTPKTIAKKNHTPSEAVQENYKPATCYAEGSYDEVVYCSVEACKHEISRTTKTIDKTEHTPAPAVRENEVGATCHTEGSYDEVVYCSVEACKHEISRTTKTIDKTEHTPGETKFENRVAASCYKEGSCDEVVYCSADGCKHEISRKHVIIPVNAHTSGNVVRENVVPATCYAEGSYDAVIYCAVDGCDAEISRTFTTIDTIAHTHGDAIHENINEATCGEAGSYDEVHYCTIEACKHEISRETVVVPATEDHNYTTEIERVEPSCTADGHYVMQCACGATQTTPIKSPGHSYQTVVTAPTCTAGGYTTYICLSCTESIVADQVPALGHKDTDGNNLCDNAGCDETVCNNHDWTEISIAWLEGDTVTCIATRTCKSGNHTETAVATVIAVSVDATCTEDGGRGFIAMFTEDSFVDAENREQIKVVEEFPATGHSLTQVEAKAPTCTVAGYEAYEHCSKCDYTTYAEIPSTGHSYNAIVTAPTCTTQGYTTHTCSACTDSYVDTYVDATGDHVYSEERHYNRKESWKQCTKCGEKYDVVARTYNVTIVDCWGNASIRKGYTYGQYLWLNYSTSNVLDLQYNGWKLQGTDGEVTVQAYEVWENFVIDDATTELIVYEDSTVQGVKYGAIMMSVSYDQANSEKTMTVDLFIYVDSLADEHKPVVKLGETQLTLEKIDDSIMMYFVSIPLSAEQITQGGTNVQITVNYQGVPVKTIDSVLIAYEEALDTYLKENVGDYAGEAQEEAINAVLNYGKAVQLVFGNSEGIDFEGYTDEEIAKYAANVSINNADNTVNGITFKWESASVNFKSEYSIRYKFTFEGANGYAPTSARLIVKDSNGNVLHDYASLNVISEENGEYSVTYPVPASDLTKAGTTVQLEIAMTDANGQTKIAESSKLNYGIYAYLARELYKCTQANGKFYLDDAQTIDKTTEYVNMLVSLIKLGEAVNRIDEMTSNK